MMAVIYLHWHLGHITHLRIHTCTQDPKITTPYDPNTIGRERYMGESGTHHAQPQGISQTHSQSGTTNAPGRANQHRCSTLRPNAPSNPKKGIRKRVNIRIATLNINGLQTFNEPSRKYEKWSEINTTMKKERIAILAIQETHLDEQPTQEIHQLFGKWLQIYNSQIGNNPRTSAGVAFIINKDLISTHDTWT